MVKLIVMAERTPGVTPEEADISLRDRLGVQLPLVLPVAGWKREGRVTVEIGTEQFPGSKPIWIWTER